MQTGNKASTSDLQVGKKQCCTLDDESLCSEAHHNALDSVRRFIWQQSAFLCHVHHLPCRGDVCSGLAALSMVPLLPGGGINDLFTNRVFLAGFWAWFAAQTLKVRDSGHTASSPAGRYPCWTVSRTSGLSALCTVDGIQSISCDDKTAAIDTASAEAAGAPVGAQQVLLSRAVSTPT